MSSVPVYEAKTRLSELISLVQQGEEITITRHGVPMARLVPPAGKARDRGAALARRQRVQAAFEALGALRQGVSLGMPLEQALVEGRD